MKQQIFGRRWSIWMTDSVLHKFPELRANWSYEYGVVCKGIEKVYEMTDNSQYFDYIKNVMDYFVGEDGSIKYYDESLHNIDYINNGKVLLYLYRKTGCKKYKDAADRLRKQLDVQPRTSEGGFWHKDIYPWQMWLDGLYMAEPFYAEYSSMFENGKTYKDIVRQFQLIFKHTRDPKTHLYYHGWDESRNMFWADKVSGCSANFWGRSMGWYACALVDVLDYFGNFPEGKETLTDMVSDLAETLISVQSAESGLWFQVLDQEGRYGNYPEASCSCMFTYFLLKTVRNKYIDESYFQYAKKAYQGILHEFIEVDQKGYLNLKRTVLVSGLGGDTMRDGSYEYYISEPVQVNNLLGIGTFIMASCELETVV